MVPKPCITIIIEGGAVQDVLRENTNIEVVVKDYDVRNFDAQEAECLETDDAGDKFYRMQF